MYVFYIRRIIVLILIPSCSLPIDDDDDEKNERNLFFFFPRLRFFFFLYDEWKNVLLFPCEHAIKFEWVCVCVCVCLFLFFSYVLRS